MHAGLRELTRPAAGAEQSGPMARKIFVLLDLKEDVFSMQEIVLGDSVAVHSLEPHLIVWFSFSEVSIYQQLVEVPIAPHQLGLDVSSNYFNELVLTVSSSQFMRG